MRIFSKRTLRLFWEKHPDAEQYLKTWHQAVVRANWQNTNDIKSFYGSASIIGAGRVVFNIKGNHYRLIVAFNFERQYVFVRFIGTHQEYDRIDARTI